MKGKEKNKKRSNAAMKKLGELMKKHGVSQVAMAKEAGVGQSTVAQTLNDGYSPRLDNVFKYLDALNTLTGEKYTLCDLNPD